MTGIATRRFASAGNDTSATQDALGALPLWNLDHLYPGRTAPEFVNALQTAEDKTLAFEARWKGRLAQAMLADGDDSLAACLAALETLYDLLGRLGAFAGLTYYGDMSDPEKGRFFGDIQEKLTTLSARLLFFPLELNQLDDAQMDAAMARSPALAHYRPWIIDLRKDKPFQLDEKLEQLFLEKSQTGANAFNRLFDETLAALRFQIDDRQWPLEETLTLMQDEDPDKRRKAAMALSKTFADNIRIFTLITNTLAKDKEISDRWRGFDDIADSRHLENRVERPVVDALAAAVKEAYPRLSHRYYAMKARWLGMEQLNVWDRNAPLNEAPERMIPWQEARETVLSAYGKFDPLMAQIAERFFTDGFIDAPARPGKAPGAFAHPTVPSAHPYVLVNYLGKPRDVMTLAHELGHGVHQVLAGAQGPLMSQTPLTLAETASVFGEMLTFRALLDKTSDPRARKAMLARKVEDMINTVVRQIAFYDFERRLHSRRKDGELTADEIGALWLSVQAESLGPAIRLFDGYETWWAYISHFVHSPFYVYAYAFGDCLVNSLYAVYQAQPEGFQEKYFALLKAGGSRHHSELLAPFGLDATDPAFWSQGLAMIEGLIDELDALDKDLEKAM